MVVFFFGGDERPDPASEPAVESKKPLEQSAVVSGGPIPLEREAESSSSDLLRSVEKARDPSLDELENSFRRAHEPRMRVEILKQIAGFDDAAAMQKIANLFQNEPSPVVQEALLSALGDIGADENPEVRFGVLTAALRKPARNVRLAALHLLNEINDARVPALLQKATKSDPDREVREAAATILRERAEETER
jgi:HEAT repeat protein